jgi:hypothetical protein
MPADSAMRRPSVHVRIRVCTQIARWMMGANGFQMLNPNLPSS